MPAESWTAEALAWRSALDGLRRHASPGREVLGSRAAAGPRLEMLRAALSRDRVARLWTAASGAGAGPQGEAARRAMRLAARPYLALEVVEIDTRLEARLERDAPPPGGHRAAVAAAGDRRARLRRLRAWRAAEERLLSWRAERQEARERAARRVGAPGLYEFLASTHPLPPGETLEGVARGAVEPLDEAVARAARERRWRFGAPEPRAEEDEQADVAALAALADHRHRFPVGRVVPVLRQLASAMGLDREPRCVEVELVAGRVWSEVAEAAEPRPVVLLGSWPGPGGLVGALARWGRAVRAAVLRDLRGGEGAWGADPAFSTAWAVLFRRLGLSSAFASWAGLALDEKLGPDLGFEEALGHREAWAYLLLAGEGVCGRSERTTEVFRRATGRPPTPDLIAPTWERDPAGASIVRGTVLGLLLEERLMTRFGKSWFLDRAAGRFITELGASESGETAESVAKALELGRIEPTPIVDLYRV